MKKTYETPSVEKVTFQYRNQVVATSGTATKCESTWMHTGESSCTEGNDHVDHLN